MSSSTGCLKRLASYEKAALQNTILKGRSQGVAAYGAKEALEWGTTGAGLRATGIDFDVRKARPYSGYENFDFEIPVGGGVSDCYTRVMLKVEELRQSLRILEQCLNNMPEGPFKADHPLTTPPPKERTLQHIETLITHFLQVSWGPVMPANESFQMVEATKGINSYYLTSDGSTMSYRTRIRTPSYAHLQQIPAAIRGSLVSDLIVYLGSIGFCYGQMWTANYAREIKQPQTEAFELSAAEREAIEHEMHHYETRVRPSIEALKSFRSSVAGCRMARSTRSPMCWVFPASASKAWQRFIARSSVSQ